MTQDHLVDTFILSQTLPFQKVQHRVDTTDAQPANETGGILVMVTGALMVSLGTIQVVSIHG